MHSQSPRQLLARASKIPGAILPLIPELACDYVFICFTTEACLPCCTLQFLTVAYILAVNANIIAATGGTCVEPGGACPVSTELSMPASCFALLELVSLATGVCEHMCGRCHPQAAPSLDWTGPQKELGCLWWHVKLSIYS